MEITILTMLAAGISKEEFVGKVAIPTRQQRNYNNGKRVTISKVRDEVYITDGNSTYPMQDFTLQEMTVDMLTKLEEFFLTASKDYKRKINYCKERNLTEYSKITESTDRIITFAKQNKIEEARKVVSEFLNDFFV